VNPDYSSRDLYEAIARKEFPTWTVNVQLIPEKEAYSYKYDILDSTKIVLEEDYPLHPVGTIVLNENPKNFFATTEESAFTPGNLVPGIELSDDKSL